MDYYSVLGVNRSANVSEIKQAFRRLAKLNHPDKRKDQKATGVMQQLTEAYNVLSNPIERAFYTDQLSRRASASASASVGLTTPPRPQQTQGEGLKWPSAPRRKRLAPRHHVGIPPQVARQLFM